MKKLLIALLVMLMTALSYTGVVQAADWVKEQDLKAVKNQRTDIYALDSYKYGPYSDDPATISQVNKIIAGITNDYEKVRAIFNWVRENVSGNCEKQADMVLNLAQAAGFPAKYITGYNGIDGHAWTLIYVVDRWIYVDSALGLFDSSGWTEHLSGYAYSIASQDEEAWDGTLYFYDYFNDKIVKEVKNFPINGLVTETYGLDIDTLYFDIKYTQPFKLNTMRVNSLNCVIFVKPSAVKKYTVTFNSNGGSAVKSVTVKADSTITKPANPTRSGYKFVGWYKDSKLTKKWDFSKDKVTKNITLYAGWEKTYTVTFNSNGGSAVKSVTVTKNSTITKPSNPTRSGYKFVAWYKDSKLTKKWDFAKDKVTKNTTLYAGWEKTYTVTFKSNGGSAVKAVTVTKNSTITKPANPTRSGYTFVAWYKDSNLTKKWDFAKDKVTASLVLYAGWKKK